MINAEVEVDEAVIMRKSKASLVSTDPWAG